MALPLIIAGASLLGSIIGAAGTLGETSAQAKAARANADNADAEAIQSDQNAEIAKAQTAEEVRQVYVMGRRNLGAARATIGASGLQADGSALEVLSDIASTTEQDARNLRMQGGYTETAYRTQATQKRRTADLLRSGADATETGGLLSAGGQLLSGTANALGKLPTSRNLQRTGG